MTIYIVTVLLFFVFAYLDVAYNLSANLKITLTFIIYLFLVFQVGLRWETGTDWKAYYDHFQRIEDFQSTSPIYTGMEYGYSFLVWLVKLFSESYTVLLIVHSVIYFWIIIKGIDYLTPFLFISLMLFYASTMGVLGSHRQLIAVAIVLYSLKYVIERRIYSFIFCILLAVIFHTTAIICLIFYFLNKSFNIRGICILILISIISGKTSLPMKTFSLLGNLGGEVGSKIIFYLEKADSSIASYAVTFSGLIKRILFISIFLISKNKLTKISQSYNLLLNGYIVGIVIYFLFSSSLVVLVSRGSLYFNMLEPVLLGYQFALFRKREEKFIILVASLIFAIMIFFQSIGQYPQLFIPYKGIFINSDYSRDFT